MADSGNGHLPFQGISTNLCIVFIQLVEFANFEEQDDISIPLLDAARSVTISAWLQWRHYFSSTSIGLET